MDRVCFRLQVRPECLGDYRRAHEEVWPEMLDALRDSGWANYSLFLDEDGLLIGYVETENLQAAQEAMARTEVNAQWQAQMSAFFQDLDGAPDTGFTQLPQIFHLETQLAEAQRQEIHAETSQEQP
nr:L-rhamnose mutarotase [Psychromicrobium sp. YIM S02556]